MFTTRLPTFIVWKKKANACFSEEACSKYNHKSKIENTAKWDKMD